MSKTLIKLLETQSPPVPKFNRRNSKVFNKIYSKALETLSKKEKQLFPLNQTFTLKNSLMKNFAKDSISEDYKVRSRNGSSHSNYNNSQYMFKSRNEFTEKENYKTNLYTQKQLNGHSLIDLENKRKKFNFNLRIPNNRNIFSSEAYHYK